MGKNTNQSWLAIATAVSAIALPCVARDINVRGIVTDPSGAPLQGVTIYDANTDRLLASTNDEGKYLVIVDSEGKLLFSILGMEDTEVPVEGRLAVDVTLTRSAITLGEVFVKGKSKLKVVSPEPTDIEMKGNYAYIKTRVKVPGHLFNSSTRLIIQPALYNVTEGRRWFLKPLVYDGKRYDITQERMHDFRREADPLSTYVTVKHKSSGGDDIITWSDSVYLKNPEQDFYCDMMMAMENYNKVFYRDTTRIARGTVNPMRFFKYNILGSEITDSTFYPSPEMQMRDTKGDVKITFRVNESNLDMDYADNRKEMNALLLQLKQFEDNPDAAIKSFAINGTASPEGSYDHNVELSKKRMRSALSVINENLSPSTRRYIEMNSDAKVENWEALVAILRSENENDKADEIEEIIKKNNGMTAQGNAIKRLPYYNSVLREKYLPRLRKVSYEYITSEFRYLNDDEIAEVYAAKPNELTRYEFFRLYRYIAKSPEEKETYLKKALEVHPNFLVAASDLSAMYLAKNEPHPELLETFIKPGAKKIPNEAKSNLVAAYLATQQFNRADSIAAELPDTPEFHKTKLYVDVLNGRFDNAIQEISAESPVNEVVLLLALKANDRAWTMAQKLGNSPEEEYLKAIAANRVDEYMAAMSHLENALRLKPELRDIAKIDGDIIELLEDLEGKEIDE